VFGRIAGTEGFIVREISSSTCDAKRANKDGEDLIGVWERVINLDK
jgi:hypothetical protein